MTIIELELLSDDLAGTVQFYKKILGLDPVATERGKRDLVTFDIGGTKLIFTESEDEKPVYHFAIDVPNNQFEEAYHIMKKRTEIIPAGRNEDIVDFPKWEAKSFYFFDNNGNILEFITRYGNKTHSIHTFSSESYISISEIGLVADDVAELADTLEKEYGHPVFYRQPMRKNFAVMGDDNGLFIIVSNGRNWYPTAIQAQPFYTRVLYYNNGVIGHIIRED